MAIARRVCNLLLVTGLAVGAVWFLIARAPGVVRYWRDEARAGRAEAAWRRGDHAAAVRELAACGRPGRESLGRLLVGNHVAGRWADLLAALRPAGPAALDAAAGVLQRSPEERLCAAEALAALGDPRGLEALGAALLAPSPLAHRPADMLSVGDAGVEALANVARRGPPAAREPAFLLLGDSPSPCALSKLLAMARDPTFAARHLALRALSSRPSREGEELLRRGLTDPDPLVRAESVHQCGARRGAAVLGDLARALGDREASVRLATAETLGLIRGGAADALLLRALDDRDPKVVQRAVRELAVRNCRAAEPALERLYPRSSCDVKADIATAFAWMDSPLADRYVRRWEQETGRQLEISSEWDN